MANLNAHNLISGSTYYAIRYNATNQVWHAGLSAFQAYNAANLASYAIGAAAANTRGDWTASDPASGEAGAYGVFRRVGGAPAESDPLEYEDVITVASSGGGGDVEITEQDVTIS